MTSFSSDIKILRHLLLTPIRGQSHQERLENFYRNQAHGYDSFRERMLHGRRELMQQVSMPEDGVWVDLGCGTGQNVEFAGNQANRLGRIELVDLSPSMLAVAQQRLHRLTAGSNNQSPTIAMHQCDATRTGIAGQSADLVTLSYSLTMIPDWFAAIDESLRLLKPGGQIAVVDFYVSRKFVQNGDTRHGWLTRNLWPIWFAYDNVHLSPDHLAMLKSRFDEQSVIEGNGKIPFLPLVRVPHYRFIGRKPQP